jgi:hypothetical protein
VRAVGALLLIAACAETSAPPPDSGLAQMDAATDSGVVEAKDAEIADAEPSDGTCPLGTSCNPIVIDAFPFQDQRDTQNAESREIDRYACAADTDESGAEVWYRVEIAAAGTLNVTVDDLPGDTVDIDVHLLETTDAATCLARDNVGFAQRVAPGTYYLVADTWVDDTGMELPGPYTLDVAFTVTPTGACATVDTDVRMFWSACDPSVPDCFERQGERYLKTPTSGPVVKEAHLVSAEENFCPTSQTDQLDQHYQLSEQASGYQFNRTESWAPIEGGTCFGQGSTRPPPLADEAWYINMYWRDRPTPGTRMIVRNPANGRAVVASAGYETGPGSNTAIAGVAEEIHLYAGTGHRDVLEIGFAADQSLPLGPIDCN